MNTNSKAPNTIEWRALRRYFRNIVDWITPALFSLLLKLSLKKVSDKEQLITR